MENLTTSGNTNVELKKKGRKPNNTNYFDIQEEEAVKKFLTASSLEEKNQIYNDYLRKPLDKMISSIIRRYGLHRKGMVFDENHADTHSFLMTKMDRFKPSKNKKAYSYFGTICKNYLMGQIQKDQKDVKRKISYEDVSTELENNPSLSYSIDTTDVDTNLIIEKLLFRLESMLENSKLNENERKLGQALLDIFNNYEAIFLATSNNKFNKNIILLSLRDMTNLTTKEIRGSMKKFKNVYIDLMKESLK